MAGANFSRLDLQNLLQHPGMIKVPGSRAGDWRVLWLRGWGDFPVIRLAPGRVRPRGGGQDWDNNSREVDMARDPKPADEPETDAGLLGSEPGGTDELGREEGGTDVLGPEEGGSDELGPEEGGSDELGPEEGGTDILRPPGR
jgi:hypothetical protein